MIGQISIIWSMDRPSTGFCPALSRFGAHVLWIALMPYPLCRRSDMLCSLIFFGMRSRCLEKQVPTLQDAFLCCDRETLLSVVEQGYARRLPGWGQATPQQRRVARKRMGRALEAMLDCAVKRKKRQSPVHIPEERCRACAAGPACIERLVQARVADLSAGAVRQGVAEGACLSGLCSLVASSSYRVWLEGPGIAASATWSLQARSGI